MRVITLNTNGIRAAARKGLFEWLITQQADVICIQETKAQAHQLQDEAFVLPGYQRYFHDAEKRGYSGVAIYSKYQPDHIKIGLGWSIADTEGRYIQLDFPQCSIASVYLPSGTSGEARQAIKYEFLSLFGDYLQSIKSIEPGNREFIFCGDFNIAHKEIDLKNWRANRKHSGFLPDERAWLDWLFDDQGFVDAFRAVNTAADQYTWWSNRGQAWAKNVGWRIDYQVTTPSIANTIISSSIYKEQRFSDHAPLIVDYDYSL